MIETSYFRLALRDLVVFVPRGFVDERGCFFETFREYEFQKILGYNYSFVQENHSISQKNVIRGLHYQENYPQGKLVRVVHGRIWDVAVDVRPTSPTYGAWCGIELSDENHYCLWIPPGFAHGFRSLEDNSTVIYKCTDYYNKNDERTILWNDPTLAIQWFCFGKDNEKIEPIVSLKDQKGNNFIKNDKQVNK